MDKSLISQIMEYGDNVPKFEAGETYISVDDSVSNGDESLNLINSVLGDTTDHLHQFTAKMFDYLSGGYINLVGSNNSAHILTLRALAGDEFKSRGLRQGDEIITTANNVGIINSARMCGIIPVVVDVDLNTLLPSPVDIETAIEEGKTKAIILTSPNGNPVDGATIRDIADEFNLTYVEDVGYGFGGKCRTVPVGDYADITIYSFNSPLLGNAGVIVSKSTLFHTMIQRSVNLDSNSNLTLGMGSNKMMQAYLDAQMDKIDFSVSMRRLNWDRLYKGLEKHKKWLRFQQASDNSLPAWAGFLVTLKEPYDYLFTRTKLMEFLETMNIGTRVMVGNVFQSGLYSNDEYKTVGEIMTSDYIHKNSFIVGCSPTMREEHTNYVISAFDEFFENMGKTLDEKPQD